jgi:hypothetical protein
MRLVRRVVVVEGSLEEANWSENEEGRLLGAALVRSCKEFSGAGVLEAPHPGEGKGAGLATAPIGDGREHLRRVLDVMGRFHDGFVGSWFRDRS